MRWLVSVGMLLILLGLGTAVAAYRVGAAPAQPWSPTRGLDGQSPAAAANDAEWPALTLAVASGLALAFGVGCIGVGMGRWTRPVPSGMRTANPFNEQPAEHGEPPVGLV